jgi:hypothetical protein
MIRAVGPCQKQNATPPRTGIAAGRSSATSNDPPKACGCWGQLGCLYQTVYVGYFNKISRFFGHFAGKGFVVMYALGPARHL